MNCSSGNTDNTHHDCVVSANGTEVAEAIDIEGSEFFPLESSDSGLLEEVVHKFLKKSKPVSKISETKLKSETLSVPESFHQPLSDNMLVSATKNDEFGVSSDYQMNALNGINTMQAMPLVNDQFMMNHAECYHGRYLSVPRIFQCFCN